MMFNLFNPASVATPLLNLASLMGGFFKLPSDDSESTSNSSLDPNSGVSSGESVNTDLDPDVPYQETWSFLDYLKGLFESQGNTIAENREYNSAEAIKQRSWASRENQLQRDWYTEMSNTAYTRSMQDLKNAGLNPILAYSNGGAAVSSTTTTPGSAGSSQGVGGDSFSSILNSLANVASAVADFLPNVNKIISKFLK